MPSDHQLIAFVLSGRTESVSPVPTEPILIQTVSVNQYLISVQPGMPLMDFVLPVITDMT